MKLLPGDIRDREMRELKIADDEARQPGLAFGGWTNALAKEGQLIAEPAPGGIGQIAGEIPPLGLELRMRVMIARKFIEPSGFGDFPVRRRYSRPRERRAR